MPGYIANPTPPTFDPKAAREALKDSAYAGKMPTLKLTNSGQAGDEAPMLDAVLNMWRKELGVKVEIEFIDPKVYMKEAKEKHGQLELSGWCADYPDPQNFLDILYHSESEVNHAAYANPEVDPLLEQARIEIDPTQRLALYNQTEQLLLQDYAVLPLWNSMRYVLVNPDVECFVLGPMEVLQVHLMEKK